MKRPNPTFLTKAVEIKEKRHNRIKIAIIVIAVLSLLTIFVIKVASMQQVYRERFPEQVPQLQPRPLSPQKALSRKKSP